MYVIKTITKFCKKCHKIKVEKIINPNDICRFCRCGTDGNPVLISNEGLSRMRVESLCTAKKDEKKARMKTIRDIEEGERIEIVSD